VNAALPTPREAAQLQRLRGLRVQRARDASLRAKSELERADRVVRERQRAIVRCRHDKDALVDAVVTSLAPHLPRWSTMIVAQRELLEERLEREEYALIGDEQALESAQEHAQAARADLTRALAREDAVRGLAIQCKRAFDHTREQKAELEVEDQGRRAAAAMGR
jgi:hypothetical protein